MIGFRRTGMKSRVHPSRLSAHGVLQCDVVTVNCPLHEGTRGLVNAELLKHFKKGAWLVNTARGAICDKDAVAEALKSGQLTGTFTVPGFQARSLI